MTWRKSRYSLANGNCAEVDDDRAEAPSAAWRKSRCSMSNGNCPEVGGGYRKSTRSSYNGNCAEVASGVRIRDSKQAGNPDRTVLTFTAAAWRAFTADPDAALTGGTP